MNSSTQQDQNPLPEALYFGGDDSLEPLIASLKAADVCAFDTEADQFHAYDPQVCLIQIATPTMLALVDVLTIPKPALDPLWEVLDNPALLTVMHAARNDLLALDRDFGATVGLLFDTMEAARFLGMAKHGLDSVVETLMGIHMPRSQARFNWRKRPLPPKVQRYAAADVAFLIELTDMLRTSLDENGWLAPHTAHCEYIRTHTHHTPSEFDAHGWRKMRGVQTLDETRAAVLHELWTWRHELCTRLNRAAFLVFPDAALLKVSRGLADTLRDLDEAGVPGGTIERRGNDLLAVIESAQTAEGPPSKPRRKSSSSSQRLSREEVVVYDALREWRRDVAEFDNLPADLIAPNDVLKSVARATPRSHAELRKVSNLLGWQVDRFGDAMLTVIELVSG